ncbi:MAG: hypothetical protein AMXMBFR44_5260 [Candidatus Campbellbacteria bacterium]
MVIKRIAVVVVLIVIAWLLTALKDDMPGRVTDIGSQMETKVDIASGISFSYPKDYALQEVQPGTQDHTDLSVTFVLMPQEDYDLLGTLEGTEGPASISILVFNNPLMLSALDWMQEPGIAPYIPPQAGEPVAVVVDGEQGVSFPASGLYESDNVIVSRGDTVVFLSGAYQDSASQQREVFSGIVGSLLFIR